MLKTNITLELTASQWGLKPVAHADNVANELNFFLQRYILQAYQLIERKENSYSYWEAKRYIEKNFTDVRKHYMDFGAMDKKIEKKVAMLIESFFPSSLHYQKPGMSDEKKAENSRKNNP